MRALLLVLVAVAGCTKVSDRYCAMHTDDPRCAGSGSATCALDEDCTDTATGVCEPTAGTCVQCLPDRAEACTDTTPICGGQACRGCELNSECPSTLCLETGRCATADEVAYVAFGGTDAQCTQAAPCGDLAEAEDTTRKFIKVTGSIVNDGVVVFESGTRTIYGDSATIGTTGSGGVLQVKSSSTLNLRGVRLHGAQLGTVILVEQSSNLLLDRVVIDDNAGRAISATTGRVIITRSIIALNRLLALDLQDGYYDVSNTIVTQNGANGVNVGGLRLAPTDSTSRFDFNTVADNNSSLVNGERAGISCSNAPTITNSILTGNTFAGCSIAYSLFSSVGTPGGAGNVRGTGGGFVTTVTATSPTYYRLAPTSEALDVADPASLVIHDIDGDLRPAAAGRDMGADERVP